MVVANTAYSAIKNQLVIKVNPYLRSTMYPCIGSGYLSCNPLRALTDTSRSIYTLTGCPNLDCPYFPPTCSCSALLVEVMSLSFGAPMDIFNLFRHLAAHAGQLASLFISPYGGEPLSIVLGTLSAGVATSFFEAKELFIENNLAV